MQTVTHAVGQSPEPVNPYAKRYIIAWALALVFYFLEYAARSSPAVMIPELSTAFGATAVGVSAIIGTYYYTYSVTNLVAGVALDRAGGKWVIAIGAFVLATGCFGFAISSSVAANLGRLLQGAGSAFAFTGAVYLATRGFSARRLATAIGVTQCLGMLGGWAGQSVVGPMIHRVLLDCLYPGRYCVEFFTAGDRTCSASVTGIE